MSNQIPPSPALEGEIDPQAILKRELLCDQLLRKCNWYRDCIGPRLDVGKVADFILADRQQTRSQVLNEVREKVIGEDEPEIGLGKRDGEYETHVNRNMLRAEQRSALDKLERTE